MISDALFKHHTDILIERGVLKPKAVQRQVDHCIVCGGKLPPSLSRLCSGRCYQQALEQGLITINQP